MKVNCLVYLFIILFSIVYLVANQTYTKRIEIVNGYVADFSVNRGEDVIAYLQPKEEHKRGIVTINNLKGEVVDSVQCNLQFQDTLNKEHVYDKGYGYIKKLHYNSRKLPRGVYLIDNLVPFVISENKKRITIVYPLVNSLAENADGGKRFYDYNISYSNKATALSLSRQVSVDKNKSQFIEWLCDSISNIDFISDLDFEDKGSWYESRLIILIGNFPYWTLRARKNFDQYVNRGGNVIAISSLIMNDKIRIDRKKNMMYFFLNSNDDFIIDVENKTGLWNDSNINNPNYKSIGCSYDLFYPTKKIKQSFRGVNVIAKNHFAFKGTNKDTIFFKGGIYNAIRINNPGFVTKPIARCSKNFTNCDVIAYDYSTYGNYQTIGGIFHFVKNNGNMVIIGNEKWIDNYNFQQPTIQRVTKNCILELSK